MTFPKIGLTSVHLYESSITVDFIDIVLNVHLNFNYFLSCMYFFYFQPSIYPTYAKNQVQN